MMHLIGWTVDAPLNAELDRLDSQALGLHHFAPALQRLYWAGWEDGRATLAGELEQTRYERDQLYERLHNPGRKFTDMMNRRIDQAAEAATAEPDAVEFYRRVLDDATTPRGVAA